MLGLHVAVDVLDHDDGVVHHQSDRQHQRQQRQQVDRIAQRQHRGEGADQRKRHRDHRDRDRTQPAQKQEDHRTDDQQRLDQRLDHLVDRRLDEFGGVVGDLAGQPGRQLLLDGRQHLAHAARHVEQVGLGRNLDADEQRVLPAEGHIEVVVLGPQRHVGDVLQPHDRAVALRDHQVAELADRVKVGPGAQVDADHLPLAGAERGQVVVGGQRGGHVGRGDPVRRHPVRVEPGAQREQARAQDLRVLDALDRIQLRLDYPVQVVGDVVGGHRLAVEAQVHRIERFSDLRRQHRLLRLRRQLILDRVDLGRDVGQRAVGVVVQAQRRGDHRLPGEAVGRHVVDTLRLGDRGLQRLRDKARNRLGVRTVISGADGDHRVLRARVLVHCQAGQRAQPQHQDQQADDRRQHWAVNENIGEVLHVRLVTISTLGPPSPPPLSRCAGEGDRTCPCKQSRICDAPSPLARAAGERRG